MSVTPKLPESIKTEQQTTERVVRHEVLPPTATSEITPEELELRHRQRLVKWSQIFALVLFVLEVAIAFRLGLKLIAANPASPFANFIYGMTELFLAPFAGLTVSPAVEGAVLEVPAIIAMAAYAVLYWLILRFMWVIFDPAKARDAAKYKPDV
ncbi:hypothetical protein TFLX_00269 [Thermoflexales bacterium]|jgi:hypothetical protein|nr:hypothetical protein TFLX_00269 [Thermoflexales bacterium]